MAGLGLRAQMANTMPSSVPPSTRRIEFTELWFPEQLLPWLTGSLAMCSDWARELPGATGMPRQRDKAQLSVAPANL